VVDIGLPPAWVDVFTKHGWSAVHWSAVGDPRAKDRLVMAWAREHRHVVFTHDLDFSTLLALTRATGPSVIQVRSHNVLPDQLSEVVVRAIRANESQLEHGAIVTIDEFRGRVRILPIGPTKK
jgi:predicted nuclease of predicted toxin-antitoxin system